MATAERPEVVDDEVEEDTREASETRCAVGEEGFGIIAGGLRAAGSPSLLLPALLDAPNVFLAMRAEICGAGGTGRVWRDREGIQVGYNRFQSKFSSNLLG